jgi:2-C-methyl-D-erythritol 4-phosphate cytidylyltransferase
MELAVILAGAGEGLRMNGAGPKLLLDLRGRSLLERVARTFLSYGPVGEIVAVVPAELLDEAQSRLARLPNPRAVSLTAVTGGGTRQESVRLGLQALTRVLPYVAVHDVARALVSPALIERVLDAARGTGGAIPAVPLRDTVKQVSEGRVTRTVPRAGLAAAQTPQIFASDILARAYEHAAAQRIEGTDDASLAEAIGAPVAVVAGDPANIKLTEPTDLMVLQALLDAGLGGAGA